MISKEKICTVLNELEIKKGDVVLLHSSLSSMGRVDGGAEAVIEAFIEVLGTGGTLAMPAFSDDTSRPFDTVVTPSDTGIMTEKFRQREDVLRSYHPTHSVCAFGKFAGEITESHQTAQTPCGKGTPFEKIHDFKGKIVLLGVDMNRNTILHTAEDIADIPYLMESLEVPAPTYVDGYPGKTLSIKKMPLGHRDFLKLTPYLRKLNLIKEAFVGSATIKVMDSDKLLKVTLDILCGDPGFFLCGNYYCNSCVAAGMKVFRDLNTRVFSENRCKMDYCEICSV